jgi:hypothetical protein
MPRWERLFKWPHLLWLLLLVVINAAYFAAYIAEQQRRTSFWHKYDQLRGTMTRTEVEKILGPPTDDVSFGGGTSRERLRWVEGEQEIVVGFIPLPDDRSGGTREVAVEKQFYPGSLWEKVRDTVHGK